jgi:hypothetical protein
MLNAYFTLFSLYKTVEATVHKFKEAILTNMKDICVTAINLKLKKCNILGDI